MSALNVLYINENTSVAICHIYVLWTLEVTLIAITVLQLVN